jgi:hypothetical protein
MIKIISGWSNKGGSTTAFINLTNALNNRGYETKFFGPHDWHLDKCNAGILTSDILNSITVDDSVVCHFIGLQSRPNAKSVILSCHEKNLYRVGQTKQFWDEVVFINKKHRDYHSDYLGKFTIIPNLIQPLNPTPKEHLDNVAGIIGTFDENKQTHVSIIRALKDNCEKIYLFGTRTSPYYENFVKPLLSEKVIEMGYLENKQEMYDMIGRVYHSSISEVATLVKDECISTNTKFFGNEATNSDRLNLTNEEIINEWIKILKL